MLRGHSHGRIFEGHLSDRSYAEKALKLFKEIVRFISTPGILEPKYLPTQPAIGHSITMILINTASRIREVIPDPELDRQIDNSLELIRTKFMHPEFKALLEMVTPEGELIDTINGRVINPGILHRNGMVPPRRGTLPRLGRRQGQGD